MSIPNIIAFYLPQFYPTKENDEWWNPGFTEWTNVAKARPLFRGHHQPNIPRELGFYDLRMPEIREVQAKMAKEAGIDGFCYWHYWFNGRRLLDRVFTEVVEKGKPDFPFCLCWANHSWYKKTWSSGGQDKLLIEQTYGGEEDYKNHFYSLLEAFKDPRYMNVNSHNIFGIFDPLNFKDIKGFMDSWNKLAIENGLKEFWFFGYSNVPQYADKIRESGIENIVVDFTRSCVRDKALIYRGFVKIIREKLNIPVTSKYDDYINIVTNYFLKNKDYYPCIIPNFDHSPRSGAKGTIITGSTPYKWGQLVKKIIKILSKREKNNDIIFIKAWNEWGEGNYLEPDLRNGMKYLEELSKIITNK